MKITLGQHFVAFIDILGFSELVESDVRDAKHDNLARLYRCHQQTAAVFRNDPNCQVNQFSDSVIISQPFSAKTFARFIRGIAHYQRVLLKEGVLCRGGIAVNKHFSNGSFTFSPALIEAFRVERTYARFPRVVVSQDVLGLLFPDGGFPKFLVKEDDGLVFVDYLGSVRASSKVRVKKIITQLVSTLLQNGSASVREKAVWLAAYSDYRLNTRLNRPRFDVPI
jgi:hypothetical protein